MEEKTKSQKYLISIIPLTRIPLTRDQFFYYLADNPIPTGSLCEIPFGRWKTKGVVLNSKNDFARAGGMELKKVSKILIEKFLTKRQLEFAQFISNCYLSPLGIVLKHFLPTPTKARKKKITRHCEEEQSNNVAIPDSSSEHNSESTLSQNSNFKNLQDEIFKEINNSKNQTFILQNQFGNQKNPFILNLIKKILENKSNKFTGKAVQNFEPSNSTKKPQILYLLPEVAQIFEVEKFLSQFFKNEEIVLLHSKLTKGQFFENWEKIRNGQAKIIIGSRMAIFAPFQNLSAIFIDNYTDISYKQWDMNPRYNSPTLTKKLSQIFNCLNFNTSSFPSVSDYFLNENQSSFEKEAKLFSLPIQVNFTNKLNIVDLKKERWQKRFSPISQELEFKLKRILEKKEQALLFINRQGLSAFSVCAKCKTPLKCPQCERALVGKKDGTFTCLHCNFTTDIFPKCPKCFSLEFKNLGLGTEKIEKELKKIFPKARIEKVDRSVKFNDLKKIHHDFETGKINILIGTQMITENWNSQNLTLTAVLDFDSLTSLPEFNASEKSSAFLLNLYNKIIDKRNGEMIIQTFDEFNSIFEAMKTNDFTKIYKEELENRKALKYPPFANLIKLVYRNSDKNDVVKNCQTFFEKIDAITKNDENLRVIPPHAPLLNKIRTHYRHQIVIKYKDNLPEDLVDELKRLDKNWAIDVDPISLL